MPKTNTPPPAKQPGAEPPAKRAPRRTDAARLPLVWSGTGNTREGELYRRICRQLREHLGGKPSHAQELLIGRIAWMQVHLAHIDTRAMQDGGLSPHAVREYLAWSNSLAKMLARLGMAGVAAKPPTLADYLASRSPMAAPPAASVTAPVHSHAPTPGAAQRLAQAERGAE